MYVFRHPKFNSVAKLFVCHKDETQENRKESPMIAYELNYQARNQLPIEIASAVKIYFCFIYIFFELISRFV